jgi:hypothetical protein
MTRDGCNVTTCPDRECKSVGKCRYPARPQWSCGLVSNAHDATSCPICNDSDVKKMNIDSPIPKIILEQYSPLAPRQRLIDADSATRKTFPMAAGLLDYFPDALAAVSQISYLGNEKHNPGEPMHHARGKSMDHADCILRHLVGRGGFDGELRESAALAWRALALLQEELEREMGLPLPRGAK